MKAEIMRELGEFATVETLYKDFFVFPPLHNYAGAYGVVLQLARAGNSRLVIFEDG
jgi:hypothetical protein